MIKQKKYEILKKYFDEVLNKNKNLFETSNDEPTPIGCIEEMLSKIPKEFWMNKEIKIIDPCCGNGNFPLVATNIMLKHNHSIDEILSNNIFFNEINKKRVEIVKKIFGEKINITQKDFLIFEDIELYDLVMANPPYAKLMEDGKRASKNHTLIRDFIDKAVKITKNNGYIVFIVPDNWMSLADRNEIIKILCDNTFIWLNIHESKKWFPKIGSSFTWFVLQKKENKQDSKYVVQSKIKDQIITSLVRNEKRSFIPLVWTDICQNIINKTLDKKHDVFGVETSSDLHKYTKKDLINKNEDHIFKYKLIHTPKQTVWAKRPHKFQNGYKVFISTTDKYKIFIDSCGMTQSIAFIRCKDKKEAETIKKILEHPLYVFLNNVCRWGNFNNIRILQKLPKPINLNNIYTSFGINDDEIKFIESVIK